VFCALPVVADEKRTSNRDRDPLIALKNDWPKNDLALFAGLTPALRRSDRRRIARRASLCAAIILVVAVIIGQIVLDAMGIRLRSLQIGGGFILFVFGLQMVFGWMNQPSASVEKGRDLAVFHWRCPPLLVPERSSP
jgi:multiple antibiotic resistance protein